MPFSCISVMAFILTEHLNVFYYELSELIDECVIYDID